MVKSKRISIKKALAAIVLGVLALYIIYLTPSIGLLFQVIAAVVVLFISGITIQGNLDLKGGYGLSLLGGRAGIKFVSTLAKSKGELWEQLAMWGLTLGCGIFTYPLVKGRIKKSTYVIGIISLAIIYIFIIPYIAYGLQFVSIPNVPSISVASIQLPTLSILLSYQELIPLTIILLFGFAGFTIYGIAYNAGSIIYSLSGFVQNPTAAGAVASGITTQIPGVAPLIPGITTPLLAGLASLAILVIVHEFSHGVLARRAKVKIKSIGVLLFGFIPIGGFVEPNEKMVLKLKPAVQTNIFSAGIAINFIFMILFFLATVALVSYVIPHAYQNGVIVTSTTPGYPANGILQSGMIVLNWNGANVTNITTLENAAVVDVPGKIVNVVTNRGAYSFIAIAESPNSTRGVIGVNLGYKPIIQTPYAKFIYFLFTLCSLSMLLNFLVAVVNLLPIPGFDGWRVYKVNIKNERLVNTVSALIIILLVVNVIPWFFLH